MEIVRPIVQECFIPAQYTSSPEIIKNCLKDVLNEGIMVTQVSAPADNEDMTKKQRENIIKKHMEQFTTKYYESDRRWHSFLPDTTHPRGMKPIAKRKWEDLEAVILAYYEEQEQSNKPKAIAPRNVTAGEYITVNSVLYLAISNIPFGEPIITGQNAIETTIEEQLAELAKGE